MTAAVPVPERIEGLFVTFEGGDGVGKTTQATLLEQWLTDAGRAVVRTREPGGTDVGVLIRDIVLHHRGEVAPRAEALLYAADRAHHVETVVRRAGRLAGPFARLSARSCTARSKVTSMASSPRGIVAFVSPSVTYGPKRPSLSLIGLPLVGSASNSLRAELAPRAPYFGCA